MSYFLHLNNILYIKFNFINYKFVINATLFVFNTVIVTLVVLSSIKHCE